jgi:small multidrug resistance pump
VWVALPLLFVAIVAEVASTAALPRTESFSVPGWTLAVLAGYGLSTWLLAIVIRYLDVSVVYAIWAGVGTAGIAVIGVVALGETFDVTKVVAISLIISGVVVLNLHGAH